MSLLHALKKTGLYALTPGGIVHSEASAYEAALAQARDALCAFADGAFLQNAPQQALLRLLCLRGLPAADDLPEETLRGAALALSGLRCCTMQTLAQVTDALGARLTFEEDLPGQRLFVRGEPDGLLADTSVLEAFLRSVLPVGIDVVLDTGALTWDDLDAGDLSAQALDEHDLTWSRFDLLDEPLHASNR